MIEGFDVSHHQNPSLFDWSGLQTRGIKFLVARATYGKGTADKQFTKFATLTRQHGIHFGAYLFYRQVHSAAEQLELFEQQLAAIGDLQDGDLYPTLDMEDNEANGDGPVNARKFSDDCKRISEVLRKRYGGVILYQSSYFQSYFHRDQREWMKEDGYFNWLADYNKAPGKPRTPYTPQWHIHQPRVRREPEYANGSLDIDYDVINPEKSLNELLIGHKAVPVMPSIDVTTTRGKKQALNTLKYSRPPLPENDDDSRSFIAAVGAFQSHNVDPEGLPLDIDGDPGPLTQAALLRELVKQER